jgi:hypothetical protein
MGGTCRSIVNRVVRSTSVPIAERFSPKIRSPVAILAKGVSAVDGPWSNDQIDGDFFSS